MELSSCCYILCENRYENLLLDVGKITNPYLQCFINLSQVNKLRLEYLRELEMMWGNTCVHC